MERRGVGFSPGCEDVDDILVCLLSPEACGGCGWSLLGLWIMFCRRHVLSD